MGRSAKIDLILPAFLLLCFLVGTQVRCQDVDAAVHKKEERTFRVEYVKQLTGNEKKNGGGRLIADLILGKEETSLLKPVSISCAGLDDFWIADQGSGSILRFEKDHAERILPGKSYKEPFPSLVATCALRDGRLAFTDSRLNQVFIYDPVNEKTHLLNDSLALVRPTGICFVAESEEIWVSETGVHQLLVFDVHGKLLRRIGEQGNGPGEFHYPTHLSTDPQGRVLVVDAMNFRVQVFSSSGDYRTMFGEQGNASGYFARPKGIATDSFGHIYVADALFHVVQVFDASGHYLYAFGSQGTGEGQFWMPAGICIDRDNHIFVSDSFNKRIQVFRLVENTGQ